VTEEGDPENPLSGKLAYRLKRVGSVDGEPVLLETFWFDSEVFPFFDQLKVAGRSLSEAVQLRYRLEASSAEQRFSVKVLEGEAARLLNLEEGAAVLHVERTLHFRVASAAVFARMDCRSDRFTFSQHISTDGPLIDEGV
jgi:GntR family transcriptional regulator